MHVESYVKISRCVENVYVRHVENHIENCVEVRKKHHHTLRHMLILRGRFRFSCVTEVRHINVFNCPERILTFMNLQQICCLDSYLKTEDDI